MASTLQPDDIVKDWYIDAFETDPIGPDLPDRIGDTLTTFFDPDIEEDPSVADDPVRFSDYMMLLENGYDIYTLMGQGNADSTVRERIFDALEDIYDIPYDTLYSMWGDKK